MNKKIRHFPFPPRDLKIPEHDVFYSVAKKNDPDYIDYCYQKNTSVASTSIANQFFSIESIMIDAFEYVLPIENNADSCSVKFATIIRESCNLYEIISRSVYLELFDVDLNCRLDIYNFLSLDAFLNFSAAELRAPMLDCYHSRGNKIAPYSSLKNWNRNELLQSANVPKWWTAYNKIKHDINSLTKYATLDNSIYSLSALFLLIKTVYGDGLICGFLRKKGLTSDTLLYQIRKSDIFFGEVLKTGK